jgi:ATP/maltotriose-dependent transcriptional regulator MalT
LVARPSLEIYSLLEPLTRRELEVLTLLQGPFSIKEIAQKLNISYATAKEYTIHIYSKLDVNRRWDAVAKAEELNILPTN